MAISTFGELTTAVAEWTGRDDIPASTLSNFVQMTEAMFNYGDDANDFSPLRCRQMEKTATVTVSSGEGDLPSDYLEAIKVKDPANTTRNILYALPDWLDDNFPTGQDDTYPQYYTIIGETLVCPISVSLTYYRTIPTLTTGSSTSNWLITASPNAYLFGSLMQYSIWSKNPENVVYYRSLTVNAVSGLQKSSIASKAGRLERRSAGGAW